MLVRGLLAPSAALFLGGLLACACTGATPNEFGAVDGVVPARPSSSSPSSNEGGVTPSGSPEGGTADASGLDGGTEIDTTLCDDGLALASTDPLDAAKALGLCKKATVISARYTKPDGTPIANPESWGILTKLGPNMPTEGKAMVALSSGTARPPGDLAYLAPSPNGLDKGYQSGTPTGQPRESSVCTDPTMTPGAAHDGVSLELQLRVPASAKSLSFNHMLFTTDYPQFLCSQFNDVFVVMMDPKPAGLTDGNIVFDAHGDSIGVNSSTLLRACTPGPTNTTTTYACPLGPSSLVGTGFDDKASTGWLTTTVPVQGGTTITLRFMIWDSGDGILDSTVLVDQLAFSAMPVAAAHTQAH